jgi:hypothetical protein
VCALLRTFLIAAVHEVRQTVGKTVPHAVVGALLVIAQGNGSAVVAGHDALIFWLPIVWYCNIILTVSAQCCHETSRKACSGKEAGMELFRDVFLEGYVVRVDRERRRMLLQMRSGEVVSCTLTEEQADEVATMTGRYVRVTGTVTTNLVPGKTGDVRVHTIEPFKEFWQERTLDALAMLQGRTSPDLKTLYGTWPGEVDDRFEEFINRLRKGNCAE